MRNGGGGVMVLGPFSISPKKCMHAVHTLLLHGMRQMPLTYRAKHFGHYMQFSDDFDAAIYKTFRDSNFDVYACMNAYMKFVK